MWILDQIQQDSVDARDRINKSIATTCNEESILFQQVFYIFFCFFVLFLSVCVCVCVCVCVFCLFFFCFFMLPLSAINYTLVFVLIIFQVRANSSPDADRARSGRQNLRDARDFSSAYVLPCKKEKTIRSTGFRPK